WCRLRQLTAAGTVVGGAGCVTSTAGVPAHLAPKPIRLSNASVFPVLELDAVLLREPQRRIERRRASHQERAIHLLGSPSKHDNPERIRAVVADVTGEFIAGPDDRVLRLSHRRNIRNNSSKVKSVELASTSYVGYVFGTLNCVAVTRWIVNVPEMLNGSPSVT